MRTEGAKIALLLGSLTLLSVPALYLVNSATPDGGLSWGVSDERFGYVREAEATYGDPLNSSRAADALERDGFTVTHVALDRVEATGPEGMRLSVLNGSDPSPTMVNTSFVVRFTMTGEGFESEQSTREAAREHRELTRSQVLGTLGAFEERTGWTREGGVVWDLWFRVDA